MLEKLLLSRKLNKLTKGFVYFVAAPLTALFLIHAFNVFVMKG